MSQLATKRGAVARHPALTSLGIVSTSMGFGALIGAHGAKEPQFGPLATLGGAIAGAGLASVGGAVVAASSKTPATRHAGWTTAMIGIGSIGVLLIGTSVIKAIRSPGISPASPATQLPAGTWVPLATATVMQPGVEYRLSDAIDVSELKDPPTLVSLQDYLGPLGVHVDGAWVQVPPSDWPAGDASTPTAPRAYIEFTVTHAGARIPSTTSGAKLYALRPFTAAA